MIVVDTNIISHMTFSTPYSEVVNALHQADPVWEAPVLWRSEFLNVVSLYHRKKIINDAESINAIEFAERLIGSREHTLSPKSVLNAIINSTCSSYDCEFVVLAEALNTKLLTFDKKILSDFPKIALRPEIFLEQQR